MKAVIPAAGLGTRFLPATKSQPKEMLPLVDKPSIQYVVEECSKAGIDDILIITGRGKRAIEDHFDRSFELEENLDAKGKEDLKSQIEDIADLVDIHYIRQKKALGLGHAIMRSKKHVGAEDFCVLLGDDIVFGKNPAIGQLIDLNKRMGGSVIAVQRFPKDQISNYGVIDGKQIGKGVHNICDLIEKPSPEAAPTDLGIIGRYLLEPEIFDYLEKTPKGKGAEIQLTDAMKLHCFNSDYHGLEFEGIRYDLGDKLDFVKATVEVALSHHQVGEAFYSYLKALDIESARRRLS